MSINISFHEGNVGLRAYWTVRAGGSPTVYFTADQRRQCAGGEVSVEDVYNSKMCTRNRSIYPQAFKVGAWQALKRQSMTGFRQNLLAGKGLL